MEKPSLIRILLVDDDEDCRLMIREAMKEGNIENEVYEVKTGEEALDFLYHRGPYAESPRPGLIYLDIDMPGISGLDVLKELRSNEQFRAIPIVMMTNLDDDREKIQAARLGANSYTLKPTSPVRFIQTVIEATNYWISVHERPKAETEPRT